MRTARKSTKPDFVQLCLQLQSTERVLVGTVLSIGEGGGVLQLLATYQTLSARLAFFFPGKLV